MDELEQSLALALANGGKVAIPGPLYGDVDEAQKRLDEQRPPSRFAKYLKAPEPKAGPQVENLDRQVLQALINRRKSMLESMSRQEKINISKAEQRMEKYMPIIMGFSEKYNVPPEVIMASGTMETGFRPGLVSPKGARGMMQFMPGTEKGLIRTSRAKEAANEMFGKKMLDPTNPEHSVVMGGLYLKQMLDAFGGDQTGALAAYNMGPNGYRRRREKLLSTLDFIPSEMDTAQYVKSGQMPINKETKNYVLRGRNLIDYYNLSNEIRKLDPNGELQQDMEYTPQKSEPKSEKAGVVAIGNPTMLSLKMQEMMKNRSGETQEPNLTQSQPQRMPIAGPIYGNVDEAQESLSKRMATQYEGPVPPNQDEKYY